MTKKEEKGGRVMTTVVKIKKNVQKVEVTNSEFRILGFL
jgi:hypothetical protein